MGARVATWLAIAVGGTAGALAAIGSSGGAPASAPAPSGEMPLRPVASIAARAPSVPATIANPTPAASAATPPASSSEPTESGNAPLPAASADAPAPTAASAKPPAPPPAADLLPLPTTKEKLLRQEMHCDQRKAESCIVAARAYETGSTGVTDVEKASKYRRIALTVWISQCDRNSSLACATLATMYRAGSGVPQSDRNADALFARARELCRFNDAPICHELPKP
jgi:TPR repeat protein